MGENFLVTFIGSVVFVVTGCCAITDLFYRKIFNVVTYPAFLTVVGFNVLWSLGLLGPSTRYGAIGIRESIGGAFCCFIITLLPYIMVCGGAGDAKLGAVIGAALGVAYGVTTVFVSFVFAGVCVVVFLLWEKGPFFLVAMLYHQIGHFVLPLWIAPPTEEQKKISRVPFPLGPSFFLGVLFVVSGLFERWIGVQL